MSKLPSLVADGARVPTKVDLESARSYAIAEKSANTRRAYSTDMRLFRAWCAEHDFNALPAAPETVAQYLSHLADSGLKFSTVDRRCNAIGYAHRLAGHESPTSFEGVKTVIRGISRTIKTKVDRKTPTTATVMAKILPTIPDTLRGKRDRAILLIGFAGALRRSELVALNVADIETVPKGIVVHVRQSKTDQRGEGQEIPIPRGGQFNAVEALETWLAASNIKEGPIFRPIAKGSKLQPKRLTHHSVAVIVKTYAAAAGLDRTLFSGHSLRAGFVTSALETGADMFKVMDVTRHKRIETLKIYDRRAKAFTKHAGKGFL